MKKYLIILFIITCSCRSSYASQIYLETEILVTIFGGKSLNIKRSSTFFENLSIGVGLMQIRIPENMFDDYPDTVGKDWEVSLKGGRLILDYHISDSNNGFTIGLHIAYEKYLLQRKGDSSVMWQLSEALRFGYVWRPIKNGLYIMPVLTILNSQRVSGENKVQGETFDADYLGFQPSIGLGYSF